jgi:hypothetical protein
MTIGMPNAWERPDRVHACTMRHRWPCNVCGFDGRHIGRAQVLECRQFRAACTCGWYGPIRQSEGHAVADLFGHRKR